MSRSKFRLAPLIAAFFAIVGLAACGGGGGNGTRPSGPGDEVVITPPSTSPDLAVGTPSASDASPAAGGVVHAERDGSQRGRRAFGCDDAALLPVIGRDDFGVGHGGGHGRGGRARGFGHERGVGSSDGAVLCGHLLLRRLRGHRDRGIGHGEQLLQWRARHRQRQWRGEQLRSWRFTSGCPDLGFIHSGTSFWRGKSFEFWRDDDGHLRQWRGHAVAGWDRLHLPSFWRVPSQEWGRHTRHYRERHWDASTAAERRSGPGGRGERQQPGCGRFAATVRNAGDGRRTTLRYDATVGTDAQRSRRAFALRRRCATTGHRTRRFRASDTAVGPSQRGRRAFGCDDAALLPVIGRDDFGVGHGGGHGRGGRARGFGHERGVGSSDGAVLCGHLLLRRLRGHRDRGIGHGEQLLQWRARHREQRSGGGSRFGCDICCERPHSKRRGYGRVKGDGS